MYVCMCINLSSIISLPVIHLHLIGSVFLKKLECYRTCMTLFKKYNLTFRSVVKY